MNFARKSSNEKEGVSFGFGHKSVIEKKEESSSVPLLEKIASRMTIYMLYFGLVILSLSVAFRILIIFSGVIYYFIPGFADFLDIPVHNKVSSAFEASIFSYVVYYYNFGNDIFRPYLEIKFSGIFLFEFLSFFYITTICCFFALGRYVKNSSVSVGLFFSTLTVFFLFLLFGSFPQIIVRDILPSMCFLMIWYYWRLGIGKIEPRTWLVDLINAILLFILISFFYSWWSLEYFWWAMLELIPHPILLFMLLLYMIIYPYPPKYLKRKRC